MLCIAYVGIWVSSAGLKMLPHGMKDEGSGIMELTKFIIRGNSTLYWFKIGFTVLTSQ